MEVGEYFEGGSDRNPTTVVMDIGRDRTRIGLYTISTFYRCRNSFKITIQNTGDGGGKSVRC